MLQFNPIIRPNTAARPFKFEPFLHREYNFGLDPDRPVCPVYIPSNPNSCPNGALCPNKHVPAMYNNKIVCKHWLRGLCKKNDHCEFLHEYNLRKMPECLFYSKNGFCTQTPECLYLHVDPQSKIPECLDYERGFCPDGPKCSKRHVRKIMCPLWLTGFCPKGYECDYSHPRFEGIGERLRITPDKGKEPPRAPRGERPRRERRRREERGSRRKGREEPERKRRDERRPREAPQAPAERRPAAPAAERRPAAPAAQAERRPAAPAAERRPAAPSAERRPAAPAAPAAERRLVVGEATSGEAPRKKEKARGSRGGRSRKRRRT
ncbi:mRNA 3'-end-processing protein [[Candida] zeylanoides]